MKVTTPVISGAVQLYVQISFVLETVRVAVVVWVPSLMFSVGEDSIDSLKSAVKVTTVLGLT